MVKGYHTTVPFRSPIQMALSLPFQNGENATSTVETVAQRNGSHFGQTGPNWLCAVPFFFFFFEGFGLTQRHGI